LGLSPGDVLANPGPLCSVQPDDGGQPGEIARDPLLKPLQPVPLQLERQRSEPGESTHDETEVTVRRMSEFQDFGLVVIIVAGGFSLAIALNKLTERFPVPAPALFLLVAAVASDIFPGLEVLSTRSVERIGVVALIVILFDGGMHVGWRRFR